MRQDRQGQAVATVCVDKGMGLVIPAFTPDVPGEVFEYTPTAIFSIGFLVFTLLCKLAIPILTGEFADASRKSLRGAGEGRLGIASERATSS